MATTRAVNFSFAAAQDGGITNSLYLEVFDSAGTRLSALSLSKTATSYTLQLPFGANLMARLTAYSSINTPCANPPTVTFDVPTPPPPAVPGNPTLNVPVVP